MFVINVNSGQETRFIRSLVKEGFAGYAPEMIKTFRKGGKWHEKRMAVFMGYVFIDIDTVSAEIYQRVKLLPNFRNFLSISAPLPKEEIEYIKILSSGSEISRGTIINGKFVITEGLLRDVKHTVTEYNKRQKTAVVEIDLYGKPQKIKYSVEFV